MEAHNMGDAMVSHRALIILPICQTPVFYAYVLLINSPIVNEINAPVTLVPLPPPPPPQP